MAGNRTRDLQVTRPAPFKWQRS
uniref:Uncharacterized protein n=1 Tax=Anguilla anguilla TaxID=7936 RepID=A0A0E9QA35_ANGAN